jgi:hypothetical protein
MIEWSGYVVETEVDTGRILAKDMKVCGSVSMYAAGAVHNDMTL